MSFTFGKNLHRIVLLNNNLPGVKRIANVFAEDIVSVFGGKVPVINATDFSEVKEGDIIVYTASEGFEGRYQCFVIEAKEDKITVKGSDLLGTIYGMFYVSEFIGVSPMVYFGDAEPDKKKELHVHDFLYASKQPSVKYRGFFINDEWPCFGTWASSKFGSVNAKCYEVIFEFLLRMKGNFLWPAMWASSFPVDGPGTLNEELATELGITVSYSHHEPCLRASEEWKHVCGENSPYGSAWNFDKNREGLLNYWRDALVRSGKFNHMITIGMRGEYDSIMLKDATLADNIEALKRIITAQKELINELGIELPLTLAIYKEVEQYFYGDENTPGLKYWSELDDVILMLCEDNHGHMRGLPTKDMREHKGGYGMYFHLDYHGGPVSYEWVNSTSFQQVFEEMTQAYESGIKDVWVVNVGDIKFNELPLYYFLQIAYDYDKWGASNVDSPDEFNKYLISQLFPSENREMQTKIAELLYDGYYLNSQRRPETMHHGVYAVARDFENDRMTNFVEALENRAKEIGKKIASSYKDGFYSMIQWPILASCNLYLMWLYADKNNFYAKQGKNTANEYGDLARERIKRDTVLTNEFDKFNHGKWHGMSYEAHTGFTTWTDFDMRLPIISEFSPVEKPLLKVSAANGERVLVKTYGPCMRLVVKYAPFFVEISNCGKGSLSYTIYEKDSSKELFKENTKTTDLLKMTETVNDGENHIYRIVGADGTTVEIETCGFCVAFGKTDRTAFGSVRELSYEGKKLIKASDFDISENDFGKYTLLKGYGKYEEGIKVITQIDDICEPEKAPSAKATFECSVGGSVTLEMITAPTNPLKFSGALNLWIKVNDGEFKKINLVPEDFRAGENDDPRWCRDVIAQERRTLLTTEVIEGKNTIEIRACEPGVILERVLVYGLEDTN